MSYNSTHFTSLVHTKLRNVTTCKLHNTYNQLKAPHRGFQWGGGEKKEEKKKGGGGGVKKTGF